MKSQPKEVHMLRIAMQHSDINYFVEFVGFDATGSALNYSQVVWNLNSKSTLFGSFRVIFTSDFLR